MAVIYKGKGGFAIFETNTFKCIYTQESEFEICHFSLFYRTFKFAVVFTHKLS